MSSIKEGYLYDPVAKKPRKATDEEYVADFYASQSECKTQDGISKIYARINALYKRLFHGKYKGILGESINIKPASLARIVCELQNYSLLETSASVKGAAYEEIVGSNLRGDKGEFFTPRGVIDAAVTMLDIQPEDICTDLACGSGGFVISMLEAGKNAISKKYSKRKGDFSETIRREQGVFSINNIVANDTRFGKDIPELDPEALKSIPIPNIPNELQIRIGTMFRKSRDLQEEANRLENAAILEFERLYENSVESN